MNCSVTIDDCIEVAGLRTTAGVRSRAETVSIENGLVAQRVLEAGAVLMGRRMSHPTPVTGTRIMQSLVVPTIPGTSVALPVAVPVVALLPWRLASLH